MTTENATLTIFRRYRDGSIVALFPYIPGDVNGSCCLCYAHCGQHGHADSAGVIRLTKPAKPEECEALQRELELIGYTLKIRHRIPSDAYKTRRDSIYRFAHANA